MGAQRLRRSTQSVIIVEVRKRDHGPPLLPVSKDAAGEANLEGWTSPGTYIHFADYLCALLSVVSGADWSESVSKEFEGQLLPAYQAALDIAQWERVWEALMKPVKNMRACYRQLHGCRNAPDLFFGVVPKPVIDPAGQADEQPVPKPSAKEDSLELPRPPDPPSELPQDPVQLASQPVAAAAFQPALPEKASRKPLRNKLKCRETEKKPDAPPAEDSAVGSPVGCTSTPTSPAVLLEEVWKRDLWDAPIPLENTFVHFREDPFNLKGVLRKAKSYEVS